MITQILMLTADYSLSNNQDMSYLNIWVTIITLQEVAEYFHLSKI